jgi:nucleoside-diphosphate-sugar epimerase
VLDVVRYFVLALEHNGYSNETFNVGSDDMNLSVDKLAILVESVFPNAVIHQIRDDPDKRSYHVSFPEDQGDTRVQDSSRRYQGYLRDSAGIDRRQSVRRR